MAPGAATTTPIPPIFSWGIFFVLLVVLIASLVMFRVLLLRWTVYHRWAELRRWADANGLSLLGREKAKLPPPLDTLTNPAPTAVLSIGESKYTFVELRTLKGERTDTSQFTRWHAVVKPTETRWPPTGLRPRANASSVLDLFPLTSFPSLLPPERFVIFGTDSTAARLIAKSKLSALLPPDIGLLLYGQTLLLDFSSRPLDTIELSRVSALLDQIWENLPTNSATQR
jgi:hypothetical protein